MPQPTPDWRRPVIPGRHSLHATNPRNLAAPRVIATGVTPSFGGAPSGEVHRILFAVEIKMAFVPSQLRMGERSPGSGRPSHLLTVIGGSPPYICVGMLGLFKWRHALKGVIGEIRFREGVSRERVRQMAAKAVTLRPLK
jgi:hypothetical protein